MKTIPNVPACQNMEEIQRLTDLIEEYIHPEAIVLFGRYAGMSFQNIKGGYEMLVITQKETEVSISELNGYLDTRFGKEERREKHLSLHLLTLDRVRHRSSLSYFLYIIRKEGILLHRKASCQLGESTRYRAVHACRQATEFSEQCLALGDAFLADAQRHGQNGIPRMAAFYLYQANLQFIRAATAVHYGFLPEKKERLLTAYLAIRDCCGEIAALWNDDDRLSQWRIFGRLQSFSYKARFSCPFPIDPDTLARCLAFTIRTRKAVGNFCAERIRFLGEIGGGNG